MPIDRRGISRGPDLNPVERVHAADDPSRSPGASALDVARQGYTVIDRAEPRSMFNKDRRGITEPVHERPDVPWDEKDYGHYVY